MTDTDVARLIVETQAYQLAALPESTWADAEAGGCNPALVAGLRAAREAFHQHATEIDIEVLRGQVFSDIRLGLQALDKS